MRREPALLRARAVALLAAPAVGLLLASTASAGPSTDYILNCRGCHRPDGSGVAGGAPSFRGQLAKFLWVPGGREYLVRVPGTAQSELSDARVAALLNWMLRDFSAETLPRDFVPFTEQEVTRDRRLPLSDVEAVRRQLVGEIEGREAAHAGPALLSQPPR